VDYRIDELARASGVTVRNIRYYQDRGMLPPPRRVGRVGIYDDAHLARLRLITRLLNRNYTAANITELLSAWERGRDLSEVLGLEQAMTGNLDEEAPTVLSGARLSALFGMGGADDGGERGDQLIAKALDAGVIERVTEAADRYQVPSPRLLYATAGLVSAGAPLDGALELAARMRRDLDSAVRDFLLAISARILAGRQEDWMPTSSEIPDLAGLLQRLRPLTTAAASSVLAGSLARHLDEVFGQYVARLMPTVRGAAQHEGPTGTAS
jgi:DNA-binding transcriptional MerR regulator